MTRHFLNALDDLNRDVLSMGGAVEAAVARAVRALLARDVAGAEAVIEGDRDVNLQELKIDEECLRILALYQPTARDLRFVTAVMKITNDLERVGDHAVNIAGCVMELAGQPPLPPAGDVPRLAALATGMLREALDAFVRRDADTARRLVRRDDEVDELNRKLFADLMAMMIRDPTAIQRAMTLILVGRNLERVADLATNVAEEVVFIAEARIIKHHAEEHAAAKREPDADDFGRT